MDVVTGNVWLDQTDISLAASRTRLVMQRSYNSALASAPAAEFGRGWSHGYQNRITHPSDAGVPNPMAYLTLRLGDGRPLYFSEDPQIARKFLPLLPRTELSYIIQSVETPTTYTRHFPDGSREAYDATGRLVSISDPVGVTVLLSYGALTGRLETISDPIGGRTLTLAYGSPTASLAQTLKGPGDAVIASYFYTGDLLTRIEYPDADDILGPDGGYEFVYDDPYLPNALTVVKDLGGTVLERHSYDLQGRGRTSEKGPASAPSQKYTLEYPSSGGLTRVTDGRGNVTEYFHGSVAGFARVSKISGPCSGCSGSETQEWEYDDQGRITAHKDGMGIVTSYAYLPLGLETETRRPTPTSTLVTTYSYYPDGRVHTKTAPNGAVTTYTYIPAGIETITETVTSSTTRVTSFSYTPQAKLQYILDPRQKTWEFHFEQDGDLEWTKDPLGFVTAYHHDPLGRLTQVVPPTTTPQIAPPITSYDGAGRVKQITHTDGSGHYTKFTYDLGGRLRRNRDPRGTISEYDYDDHGRLSKVRNLRGDPPGTLPDYITEYGYDVMSNLTSIKDARSKTTTFDYDGHNRVETITYPGNPAPFEEFEYDDAGRLSLRTDRNGISTIFSYDDVGRLTRRDYSDTTPDAIFTYDEGPTQHKGRLTSASNGTTSIAWTYDLAGQLMSEAATRTGGPSSTVSYTYDEAGNRKTLSLASLGSGPILEYTYDDRGLPAMIRRLPLGTADYVFAHDPAARRSSITFPPTGSPAVSTRTDLAYDPRSRLSSMVTSRSGIPKAEFTYPAHDPSDNRVERSGGTAPWETYSYDDVYRIYSVARGMPSETYTYDEVGNRKTSQAFPTPPWTYGDRNELLRYDANDNVSFTYDLNGNMLTRTQVTPPDAWTYDWDVENRLKRVTHNGSQVATYNYDPLGRRNQRDLGTILYTYVYDSEDILFQDFTSIIMEENMLDPPPHLYIHGPGIDEPLAVEHGNGAIWYYHTDGLGSVARMTDGSGAVTQSRQYDAYGKLEAPISSNSEGYAFTGREWDPEIGLYYYRARYYDPKIGRFISEDPIPLQERSVREVNAYPYVANNPVNLTDPLGLEAGAAMKWDFDRAMDEYNSAGGPPCTQGGTRCEDPTCFPKCMGWMNPNWGLWGAGAAAMAARSVSGGWATVVWPPSTAVGCYLLCAATPCGIPPAPSGPPWGW